MTARKDEQLFFTLTKINNMKPSLLLASMALIAGIENTYRYETFSSGNLPHLYGAWLQRTGRQKWVKSKRK